MEPEESLAQAAGRELSGRLGLDTLHGIPPAYPQLQAYFRQYQPPALVLWGQNDQIFLVAGAHAYKRDLPKAEVHVYETGHFALEEQIGPMTEAVLDFLGRNLAKAPSASK